MVKTRLFAPSGGVSCIPAKRRGALALAFAQINGYAIYVDGIAPASNVTTRAGCALHENGNDAMLVADSPLEVLSAVPTKVLCTFRAYHTKVLGTFCIVPTFSEGLFFPTIY